MKQWVHCYLILNWISLDFGRFMLFGLQGMVSWIFLTVFCLYYKYGAERDSLILLISNPGRVVWPGVHVCVIVHAAVQEERQRGKERGESEVESTSSFNEEMPVDKILDAELAVEPRTETYSDGSQSNSVRLTDFVSKQWIIIIYFYMCALGSSRVTGQQAAFYVFLYLISNIAAFGAGRLCSITCKPMRGTVKFRSLGD